MREHFGNDALRQETNAGKADMQKVPDKPGVGVTLNQEKLVRYNEVFIKEIKEKDLEISMDNPLYQAMYARPYLNHCL